MHFNERSLRRNQTEAGTSNRGFGLIFAAFFLIIALTPLFHHRSARLWALGLSLIALCLALAIPSVLAPLNRLWTRLGALLNRITSPIALGIMFYLVVTPVGLLMNLLKADPLQLKFDGTLKSYWIARAPADEPTTECFKNQF